MAGLKSLHTHPHYALLRSHKARAVDRDQLERWGAHAVGIGRKTVGGRPTNSLALIIYVERKLASGRLGSKLLPRRIVVRHPTGNTRHHLFTDVVQLPRATRQGVDPTTCVRPIPGGVSIGIDDTSGTMGGWVRDATDGEIVMLSNQHIFKDRPGAVVRQQAKGDFGMKPVNLVGKVKRSVKIGDSNRVDCAIASASSADLVDRQVLQICQGVHAQKAGALDLAVEKFGKATRHTRGTIRDADWSGKVDDDYFEDCLRIEPTGSKAWSGPGDSGSLVFAQDSGKPVVGLHFAGAGRVGYACRIEFVFKELNLEPIPR